MHPRTTAAVLLATAGLALTACGGHSSHDKTAATSTTTASSTNSSTPSATVTSHAGTTAKLSTQWVPKLQTLANSTGVTNCTTDSGSDGCVQSLTNAVTLFGQITSAITAANAATEYPKTIAEITKLVGDADTYNKDECPGDANADVDGSPCPKNAMAVVVGVTTLQFIMQTDEVNAGVK